jgi:hypothetical protein
MNIPKIKISYNLDQEVDMFFKFINDPERLQHKRMIFAAHPNLESILDRDISGLLDAKKKIIKQYLQEFNTSNQEKIKQVIALAENIFTERSEKILDELAKLMDYRWQDNELDFIAIPTALPFCPFQKNTFFFSLRGYISGERDINHILFTAAHEISHFLLFRILWENKINPEGHLLYALQEVLAPVLLNQPKLVKILQHDAKNYFGNPDIANLYIQITAGSRSSRVVSVMGGVYNGRRERGESFVNIITYFIKILTELEGELLKKKALWNIGGHKINDGNNFLAIYTSPIEIQNLQLIK